MSSYLYTRARSISVWYIEQNHFSLGQRCQIYRDALRSAADTEEIHRSQKNRNKAQNETFILALLQKG